MPHEDIQYKFCCAQIVHLAAIFYFNSICRVPIFLNRSSAPLNKASRTLIGHTKAGVPTIKLC